MRLSLICLCLVAWASGFAQAQLMPYGYNGYADQQPYFFRDSYSPYLEYIPRQLFSPLTITISTTTTTTTSTRTTTCTTSTGTLTTCTPGRRRRRGLSARSRRGLFYDEDEILGDEPSKIFTPGPQKTEESPATNSVEPSQAARSARMSPSYVPYLIQSGFRVPQAVGSNRFLFSFTTVTVSSTTTTTTISTMYAACSSVTGFQTCGSSG